MDKRTEGWGSIDNARDAHYFNPKGFSLCGRWLALGGARWESNQTLGPEPKRGSGTCKGCWKKASKLPQYVSIPSTDGDKQP